MARRSSILKVTLGANPNSSSLGIDVSFLIFGGTAAMVISLIAVSAVRLFGRSAKGQLRPTPGVPPSSAASETR